MLMVVMVVIHSLSLPFHSLSLPFILPFYSLSFPFHLSFHSLSLSFHSFSFSLSVPLHSLPLSLLPLPRNLFSQALLLRWWRIAGVSLVRIRIAVIWWVLVTWWVRVVGWILIIWWVRVIRWISILWWILIIWWVSVLWCVGVLSCRVVVVCVGWVYVVVVSPSRLIPIWHLVRVVPTRCCLVRVIPRCCIRLVPAWTIVVVYHLEKGRKEEEEEKEREGERKVLYVSALLAFWHYGRRRVRTDFYCTLMQTSLENLFGFESKCKRYTSRRA